MPKRDRYTLTTVETLSALLALRAAVEVGPTMQPGRTMRPEPAKTLAALERLILRGVPLGRIASRPNPWATLDAVEAVKPGMVWQGPLP